MQTTTTRKSAPMPTVRVICTRCASAHVEVSIDADREPVCEIPCAPPNVRIHEAPISHFPVTE